MRTAQQAAERAKQLRAGLVHATSASKPSDPKLAEAALEAGTRLAEATIGLATALEKAAGSGPGSGASEDRTQKEAEVMVARGLDLLHRLHFEVIRHDLEETPLEAVPVEEARRVATDLEHLAHRLGGLAA